MTDREKLDEITTFVRQSIGFHYDKASPKHNMLVVKALMLIQYYIDHLHLGEYQPTGRACFDKPAGTPIEHGETL